MCAWIKQKYTYQIIPFSQTFNYTGTIQSVTIPHTGLYKLEVWGAAGGSGASGTTRKGGHSVGYTVLNKNDILYIVVGGAGGNASYDTVKNGGYNGGGPAHYSTEDGKGAGSGGGATHIAKVSGLLSEIGQDVFDRQGLIVAGGAGGGYSDKTTGPGGTGGGLTGGGGTSGIPGEPGVEGGGQTGSATFFGKGGGTKNNGAGSGGGYFGGRYGYYTGGGGGSGWIGGVPEISYRGHTYTPSTENNIQSGNGLAIISRYA